MSNNTGATKSFLDENQYTNKGILTYEFIFGNGFISTGGRGSTEKIAKRFTLKKGSHIVDVGCGIGGGDAYLADTFDATVTGLDLSENVIAIARSRYGSREDIKFEVADAMTVDIKEGTASLVYSRDAILHISTKLELFQRFYRWCAPGGHVFITDYCGGPREAWTKEFRDYVAQRNYHLATVDEYAKLLSSAGFEVLTKEDKSKEFIDILETESKTLTEKKAEFLAKFSEAEFNKLIDGWSQKIDRVKSGCQVWGHFYAHKKP